MCVFFFVFIFRSPFCHRLRSCRRRQSPPTAASRHPLFFHTLCRHARPPPPSRLARRHPPRSRREARKDARVTRALFRPVRPHMRASNVAAVLALATAAAVLLGAPRHPRIDAHAPPLLLAGGALRVRVGRVLTEDAFG